MNDYEEKQADKKTYYAEKAEQLREEASNIYQQARKMSECIPFGQPILIGHHSEKRDRNFRGKINNLYGRAAALSKKAEYYDAKANTISHAISSDDGDAIQKLESKLESLIAEQARMKEINRLYKREGDLCLDKLSDDEKTAVLSNFRFACVAVKKPFPSYALTNNNQNIRRIRQRIEFLKCRQAEPEREAIQGNGYVLEEDKDDNRLLFIFKDKPSVEIRTILKRHAFKWSPTRSAWVRMLNGNGRFTADLVISQLNEIDV